MPIRFIQPLLKLQSVIKFDYQEHKFFYISLKNYVILAKLFLASHSFMNQNQSRLLIVNYGYNNNNNMNQFFKKNLRMISLLIPYFSITEVINTFMRWRGCGIFVSNLSREKCPSSTVI